MKNPLNCLLTILILTLIFAGCRSADPLAEEPTEQIIEDKAEPVSDVETQSNYPAADREFRAVWVATVANIDWPSEPGLSVADQQKELIEILDRAASLHLNAVIFQVRPAADALYESAYEPWSSYLTGTMGQGPLPHYDPLEFVVREAHKRGLELHAWFNPYRAGHPADRSEISSDHISKTNPELVHRFGDFLWLDPGLPEAKEHTLNVIMDVVERYDIDGVHFDDYFYPYPSYDERGDFPDDLSWQRATEEGTTLSKGDWRRNNVDQLIKELSVRIKEVKPDVKFGISPFGIWRPGYPENTTGFDAYDELYADAKLWLNEGWLDYFTPQIYYQMSQKGQPFPLMLEWWTEENDHDIHIWPGLYTSRLRTTDRTWPIEEILGQVYTSRAFPGVTGVVHFSMKTFTINSANINREIASGAYFKPALKPVSPWMNTTPPEKPEVEADQYDDRWTLSFHTPDGDNVRWWVLRKKYDEEWETTVLPGFRRHVVYNDGHQSIRPDTVVVTAADRLGNESQFSDAVSFTDESDSLKKSVPKIERLVKRNEWADEEPGGVKANAIRRNITPGETLQFRDLAVRFTSLYSSEHEEIIDEADDESGVSVFTEKADSIEVEIFRNGVRDHLTIKPGESFNWYGYHIGLLEVHHPSRLAHFEIATVQSLPVDRAMALQAGNASQRLKVPHKIQQITLHHTGSAEPLLPDDNPADQLRNLFRWGASQQNWWDVPYHYFIDLDGKVYEGRDLAFAGETNTSYDPRGHLLISVIGNYNLQEPTERQKEAVSDLMAIFIDHYDLTISDISTHKDWADTNCPGTYLLEFVNRGELRRLVLDRLQNGAGD